MLWNGLISLIIFSRIEYLHLCGPNTVPGSMDKTVSSFELYHLDKQNT